MAIPNSFIKNICLQLRSKYRFDNSPHKGYGRDSLFIGRKENIAKFEKFLINNAEEKQGVFLVTGYRGMGKTSFVNHVVEKYKNKQKNKKDKPVKARVEVVRLTIAQNNPNEMDVLKQIVNSLYECFQRSPLVKKANERIDTVRKTFKLFKLFILALAIPTLFTLPTLVYENEIKKLFPEIDNWLYYFQISCILFALCTAAAIFFIYLFKYKLDVLKIDLEKIDGFKILKELSEKTFSNVSEELESSKFFNIDFKGIKAFSEDSSPKRSKSFPLANAKEIEYELRAFLKSVKNDLDFIFIFDELDKVDLVNNDTDIYQSLDSFEAAKKDTNLQNLLRYRKQAVMNVISGLKNFFTTANARFIFIAGREMFDASLADVSDKQSPLSSIFTYTFNIESFLKEESTYKGEKNTSSLTNAIEEFLKYQLATDKEIGNNNSKSIGIIPKPDNPAQTVKLSDISFLDYLQYRFMPKEGKSKADYEKRLAEYSKIYFMFQAFVTYLAYRSNGSPKKLIKAFHEFVTIKKGFKADSKLIYREQDEESSYYLYFNYFNQYRIGFINYFYRPFLIQYGRSFKLYSDNAIISVPYLFDHLIKFHPFAFSRSNLELVPELLSVNKTPSIKQDLDHIITHLATTHIRDTDVELYDYKFYSKSYNEIVFLSRIFEEEGAAFNFTLDENYPVKLLLNDKIKELRSIFSKFQKDSEGISQQIFSIAFHNGNLGDLHFFDQEYDDAIGNYSDAIRPINNIKVDSMNLRDFITLVRNKLKIGLCFEKISSYEEALTFYSDSSHDVKRYISYQLNNGKQLEFPDLNNTYTFYTKKESEIFYSSSFNDLLQIIVQCFLSKIYVQEKMGLEGISTPKVKAALGDFLKITDAVSTICGRNNLIIANAFMHLGKLLYFKNSSFPTKSIEANVQYPTWLENRLKSLRTKDNEDSEANEITYRQPKLAFKMYLLALDEVMRSRGSLRHSKSNANCDEDLDKMLHVSDTHKTNLLLNYFDILKKYLASGDESYTGNHYKYIASLLSSLGDCILGFKNLNSNDTEGRTFKKITAENYNGIRIGEIFKIKELAPERYQSLEYFYDMLHKSSGSCYTISDALKCYWLSARYYEKYDRIASASFQYRKILHFLRLIITNKIDLNNYEPNDLIKNFTKFLETTIVKKALAIVSLSSGRSNFYMQNKAKSRHVKEGIIWNNISNHPDTKEVILLFEYMKLKLGIVQESINKFINSENSIATQYSRLMELDYYSKYVYIQLKPLFDDKDDKSKAVKFNQTKNFDYIVGYLFSMNSILRIMKIYGTDYMLGHAYAAYTHARIARFIEEIEKTGLTEGEKLKGKVKTELENLLGNSSLVLTDKLYHYSMAKDNYAKTIQLHVAGNAYKKTIKDMIYLEDDFNDNAYHFGAALDRYMLVKGVFTENIESCEKIISAT